MKNNLKFLLATLTTAAAFDINAASHCPDGFYREKPIMPPPAQHQWVSQINESLAGFFNPYNSQQCGPYLVVGGSMNYSTSSYPQFALYDLYQAVQSNTTDFGGASGLSTNNENIQRYFWGVYGGFHYAVNPAWHVGLELGYRKLIRTQSSVNIVYPTVPITAPLITPFRNTQTYVWDLMMTLKYQTPIGFNLFLKAGGAKVNTNIHEGNFISPTSIAVSGDNAFGNFNYSLTNIYPEVEVGAGFRFLNHFEIHVSYAKIFAPDENDIVSTSSIFLRPRKCPSLDIFTVSMEMLLF